MNIFERLKKAEAEARKKSAIERAKCNAILYKKPEYLSIDDCNGIYGKLLLTKKWKEKRESILNRDLNTCQECENSKLLQDTTCKYYVDANLVNKDPESWHIYFFEEDANGKKQVPFQGFLRKLPRNIRCFLKDGELGFKYIIAIATSNIENSKEKHLSDLFSNEKKSLCINTIPYLPNEKLVFHFIKGLHVHHKYYVKGKLPWEYPNEALVTLCETCHFDFHKNNEVKIYLNEKLEKYNSVPACDRCSGVGYLPQYEYHLNGICFKCEGKGYIEAKEE